MIQKLEINGVHIKVDEKLRSYIIKKIGKLDRFIPRHARESAHAEVFIKESNVQGKPKGSKQSSRGRAGAKEYTCEVVLRLPKETITIKESTINAFAAVDIVEAKLKNQLKKYKETHSSLRLHRRVISRLRRQSY
jgi:putative sigma-54 modulation protein